MMTGLRVRDSRHGRGRRYQSATTASGSACGDAILRQNARAGEDGDRFDNGLEVDPSRLALRPERPLPWVIRLRSAR
jgi:hypothetical protein